MTQATALSEAQRLKSIMAKHGVACTIELKVGRENTWYTRKYVNMNHHTAGSSSGLTPSYALCRNGRSDLPGPLCNGYGGRDHVYRIVCMGMANHPGAGGPLTLDGFTVPYNSARPTVWGTEWEHNGTSPWPADMVDFMARSNAAINEFLGISLARQCEHSTWTARKIDRNGYSAQRGRDEVAAILGQSPSIEAGSRVLRRTDPMMRGDDVEQAQRWAGIAEADGVFGDDTLAAIQAAQASLGLEADGVVGPATWAVILAPPKPVLVGAIKELYDSLPQATRDGMGELLNAETGTPDGGGRFNHFGAPAPEGHTSIYWTPETGAHIVHGAIRQAWRLLGWERDIGYPLESEQDDGAGKSQRFQRGSLHWTPAGEIYLRRRIL